MIDSDLRMRLLKLVDEENMTIRQASDILNVKYSTAKTILQLFRKTGRINWMNNPYSNGTYFVYSSKQVKTKSDEEADEKIEPILIPLLEEPDSVPSKSQSEAIDEFPAHPERILPIPWKLMYESFYT